MATLTVELREGDTLISTWDITPGVIATYDHALTSAEVASVTDWGNLRYVFSATGGSANVTSAQLIQSGTVELFSCIDETVASDTDYIRSSANPAGDTCVVALGTANMSTGTVAIRLRARKVVA